MARKFLTWGGVAFLIFFIAFRPDAAGYVFQTLGDGIMDVVRAFGAFFVSLAGD
jgi:hypothetical protein